MNAFVGIGIRLFIQGLTLAVVAVVRLFRGWLWLVIAVPMRVWAWIWTRRWPREQWRKLVLLFAPHVVTALIVVGWMVPKWYLVAHLHDPRPSETPWGHEVFLLLESQRRFAHRFPAPVPYLLDPLFGAPIDPPPQARPVPRSRAARARTRVGAPDDSVIIVLGAAVGLAVGVPFLISLAFGGPLWVPILLWKGLRRPATTVSGRALRRVPVNRFPRWRGKGDARHAWFLGASATKRGPLWIDPETRLMHTWVVGATGTGKTQSVLLPALRSDILAGRAAIFIDGKGDRETLSAIWSLATSEPGSDRRGRWTSTTCRRTSSASCRRGTPSCRSARRRRCSIWWSSTTSIPRASRRTRRRCKSARRRRGLN